MDKKGEPQKMAGLPFLQTIVYESKELTDFQCESGEDKANQI